MGVNITFDGLGIERRAARSPVSPKLKTARKYMERRTPARGPSPVTRIAVVAETGAVARY